MTELEEKRFDDLLAASSLGTAESRFYQHLVQAEVDANDGVATSRYAPPASAVPATKRFAVWSRRYLMMVAAADALVGGIAAAVPASISDTLSGQSAVPLLLCLVGLAVWPAAIALCRGYRRNWIGIGFDEQSAVMRAGMVVVVVGAVPAGLIAVPTGALDPTGALTPYALLKLVVTGTPFAVTLSLFVRFFARKVLHLLQRQGRSLRHVIVAGSFAAAQQLSERIQREPDTGMKVIGLCLPSAELPRPVVDGIPVLGSLREVPEAVRAMGCDAVAVTSDDATRYNYLRELAWSLEGAGVELLVDPGLVEVAGPRLHIRPLMGFPLVHVEEPHFVGWRRVVKRVSDVVLTSIGLLITAPLMLGIAAAIKLQDGGPVVFRQTRIGREGKPFTMLKFRSMVIDLEKRKVELMAHNEAKANLFKLSHDPRVTRFGQFLRRHSLDELPQLFNVLAGSMSLVGPRPHLASELAEMPNEATRRALVTPGLTGLWQISGGSDLEGEDAIRLDLRYVENWSLGLDLVILWKTIFAAKQPLSSAGEQHFKTTMRATKSAFSKSSPAKSVRSFAGQPLSRSPRRLARRRQSSCTPRRKTAAVAAASALLLLGLGNYELVSLRNEARAERAAAVAAFTERLAVSEHAALSRQMREEALTERAESASSRTSSGIVWDKLAKCESGGNWSTNTGNGFYGGFQLSRSTWRAYGGRGMPHKASREEQIRIARRIQASQGWGAWPGCAAKLGLVAGSLPTPTS